MSVYIGKKCLICGQCFKNNDDIVVCPDCGTPYHRECYAKEGKCVNNTLHVNNKTWSEIQKDEDSKTKDEGIKCSKCGKQNANTAIFCLNCGNPLTIKAGETTNNPDGMHAFVNQFMMGSAESKFTPESDIEDIKIKDYMTFVGSNPLYYVMSFLKIGKYKQRISVNFASLIFPELYFLYRKMYLPGIFVYLLRFILSIPIILALIHSGSFEGTVFAENLKNMFSMETVDFMLSVVNVLNTILLFSCALFANFLYYKKAKKTINNIKSKNLSEEEYKSELAKQGGTSFRNVFIAVTLPSIIAIILMIVYNVL